MKWLRKLAAEGGFVAALAGVLVFAAFPFYWMVITAFKQDSDLYNLDSIPFWFNQAPTLEHVKLLFLQTEFVRWIENSLLIGVVVVIITLITAVPAGYSLARMGGSKAENLGIGIFLTTSCRRRSFSCLSRAWCRCSGCRIRFGRWC